jgi:hypothetical protein
MGKSTSRGTSKERVSKTNTLAPEREANGAARRTAEQEASGRHPASVYWLITRNGNGRLRFLALSLAGGEKVLLVFSSEEAEMFLSLGQEEGFDCWQARQSTVEELISELYRSCADVTRVALDPSPEMLVERMVGLVSLSWEHFANLLVLRGRERPLEHEENNV